eukprot:Clim_evm6s217 gene=Clim_evmTU6s217
MPFYFKSRHHGKEWVFYMGKDKYENEELLKFGWPEDYWFHVDDLSSAHVYVRMNAGETWEDIPAEVIDDACHLVKANSIEGSKRKEVDVVYTPYGNLKKTGDMVAGQVGFHEQKNVIKKRNVEKNTDIVRRLNRTKEEKEVDLAAERDNRDRLEREKKKKEMKAREKQEKDEADKRAKEAEERDYKHMMKAENMISNLEISNQKGDIDVNEWEEDFM